MKPLIDRLHERFASTSLQAGDRLPDVEAWSRFLASLPPEKDCIDKAFNKYRCRMYFFSTPKRAFMNFLGFGAMFVELFYLLASNQSLKEKEAGKVLIERARDIPNFDDIVPQSLFSEYPQVDVVPNFNKKFGTLCREAKRYFFRCVKRHPFHFFFNYFVYMELAAHSHFLLNDNPEATVVYINERNVASPILTELYEAGGRKLMSFMHGEYAYSLVMAHMQFSRFYVWDDHYVDLFKDLDCSIGEYMVYTPGKLQKKWDLENIEPEYFCTYYFSGEGEQATKKAAELLEEFHQAGKRVKVRPHPRSVLQLKQVMSLFHGIEIEDPHSIALKDSLAKTEYVIGTRSTVLSEAYAEGRKIVLDDVSSPEHFNNMKIERVAILSKEHILLSQLRNEVLNAAENNQ